MTAWVYGFDEIERVEKEHGAGTDEVRGLLGGKGANLAEMVRLGIPVPPGFTVTTDACRDYLGGGGTLPEGLWEQVLGALARVEEATGARFGDPERPLLVSCRSGARFSMPGMMDTVLNLGLNDDTAGGLARLTGDPHFVADSYRRLVQMFGSVVLGLRDELFDHVLSNARAVRGVATDAELSASELEEVVGRFRDLAPRFPIDPHEQLRMAVEAVFRSWNGRRAVDYRRAAGIPDDLGTAVNIQAMVFGNAAGDSATGVAMTRSGATGAPGLEGDWLPEAQGEDVVSGTRATLPLPELDDRMPEVAAELRRVATTLERHHRDMQDIEFTVEDGRLWLLQTRDGKRTARAAVRIAVDLAEEGLITRTEAVRRIGPDQVDVFLHPQFAATARRDATRDGLLVGHGLDVSPGAAVGMAVFDPDLAVRWAAEGRRVLLVRPETKPDDVHGMLAAEGILTTRGGRTSHAALVARQFGKPAVVGVAALDIDPAGHRADIAGREIAEGDWLSIDGSTGEVFAGRLDTVVPDLADAWLSTLLSWADERRRLRVRANADDPRDADRARAYGAEGIGLCRTEHMFFATDRLPAVRRMIMSTTAAERRAALDELLPLQREDFVGLLRAMSGRPVVIRLLDPPLHEFLPTVDELSGRITDAKIGLPAAGSLAEVDALLERLRTDEDALARVTALHEANPMLGLRGVRLMLRHPDISRMQARAVAEAVARVRAEGGDPQAEIMIPLVTDPEELVRARRIVEEEIAAVAGEQGDAPGIPVGTMIETPRAALLAGRLAADADFFSFGTNDLTQTTFAISRDDAEAGFLLDYLRDGVLRTNPFDTLDTDGVGALVDAAVTAGREVRDGLGIGICGEHGGDPATIAWCHDHGLDYVSCSPYRVPVARLAAAHAALAHASTDD